MDKIEQISESQLQEARDRFHAMLQQKTEERDWQKFFTKHPHVLSRALPLRIEPFDIVPLGRPGRTEPDFIFYPQENTRPPLFGMFELKRPDSQIVTLTRSNVAQLSRDAETAVQQLCQYEQQARSIIPAALDTTLFIGNQAYLFAIMGRSSELIEKLSNDLYREMIRKRLPGNLQILPYDILLKRFELSLPQKILVLVPHSPQELIPSVDPTYDKFVISDAGKPRTFLVEHEVHNDSALNHAVFEAGFEAEDRWGAIPKMLKVMFHRSGFTSRQLQSIEDSFKKRESSLSTGIGFGIALPHASSDHVTALHAGFFQFSKGINWDALDNQPATLGACFLVPGNQFQRHVQTLARVAKSLHKWPFSQTAARIQTVEEWRTAVVISLLTNK